MELYEAINNPGTGASMRRALKVLAKEWRRRGGQPCKDEHHIHLVQNMPLSLLQRQLIKLGACEPSIAWAGQFSTARQAWEACSARVWLCWLIRAYSPAARLEVVDDVLDTGDISCAGVRRVVPFECLRELSNGK